MADTRFTALLNPDRAIYSYFENGRPGGIISDIAEVIIGRSVLNIDIVETADRAAYREATHSENIDIRLDTWYNFSEAESAGYRLTKAYLDASISKISLHGNVEDNTVALLRDADLSTKYLQLLEGAYEHIAYFNTIDQLMDGILRGDADAGYLYTQTCELYICNDVRNRLISSVVYNGNLKFAVVIRADRNRQMASGDSIH